MEHTAPPRETRNDMDAARKLLDGWGTSEAYGTETVYLHRTEIEQLARLHRAATCDDRHPQGWPSDAEARAAFTPLTRGGERFGEFCRRWQFLQAWRDAGTLSGAGIESPKAAAFHLWGALLKLLDICYR